MRERFTLWRLGLCLALLGSLSACATVQVVPAERLSEQRLTTEAVPVGHIYVANWGVFLFKYVPLVTGSLSRPGAVAWPSPRPARLEGYRAGLALRPRSTGISDVRSVRAQGNLRWQPTKITSG